MDKYTYSNLIIDPTKEGIESLIGKEVYCHDNPCLCLKNANKKSTDFLGVLMEIHKNNNVPFCVKQKYGVYKYTCIIEKKEEPKPKYMPFKDMYEFVNRNLYLNTNDNEQSLQLLNMNAIWLRYNNNAIRLVTDIWTDGVYLGSDRLKTKWEELFSKYTFLDGSPCGKLAEEDK